MTERSKRKLERSRRRARAAELTFEGKSVRQASDILRQEGLEHVDKSTLSRDLAKVREELNSKSQDTIAAHRSAQHQKLLMLEDFIARSDMADRFQVEGLLGVHNSIARLLGLNAEKSNVNVAVLNASGQPAIPLTVLDEIFREEGVRTGSDDIEADFRRATADFVASDFRALFEWCRIRRESSTRALLDAAPAPDLRTDGPEDQPNRDQGPSTPGTGNDQE